MNYHYSVFNIEFFKLEAFLNKLEHFAFDTYDIISIIKSQSVVPEKACVIVRFKIIEDVKFDIEDIRKNLL